MKEQIIYKSVDDLVPYENNPRKNDEAVEYVANSIREFGFKVPIVIDENNTIVAGHTRLKASKTLGIEEVPVIVAKDLTDEQVKAFRLADNKTAEIAEWDEEMLQQELGELTLNVEQFGFKDLEIEIEQDNPYTSRIEVPFYEPTGEEVSLRELVDTEKHDKLVAEINQAEIPLDVRDFLIMASQRHLVFNYRKIAEYYSNADKEVQELMERSALVIIDFEDALKEGYVKVSEGALEMVDIE